MGSKGVKPVLVQVPAGSVTLIVVYHKHLVLAALGFFVFNYFGINLSLNLSLLPSPTGCRQHGCSSQPVLCHGEGPAAPAGDHPGPGLHGQGAAHPVLQINTVQAHPDHLLQGRGL